jgi:hypothetical protein
MKEDERTVGDLYMPRNLKDKQTMDICTRQAKGVGGRIASFVIGSLEGTMYKREEYFYMGYVLFVVWINNCTFP